MKKLILLFLVTFLPLKVFAELRIDITRGNTEPIPIALLKFNSNSNEEEKISTKINNVVSNNLQRSGLFKVLPEETFLEKNIKFNQTPTFSNWKLTTSQGLIHGRLSFKRNQSLVLEFRLWDVFSEKQMVAQQLTTEILFFIPITES